LTDRIARVDLHSEVAKPGGVESLFLSGEGVVVNLTGTGRVWFQARSASFLHPFLSLGCGSSARPRR